MGFAPVRHLKTQCFAKPAAWFVLQSPLGVSFILAHQDSLPTSGEHAVAIAEMATMSATAIRWVQRNEFLLRI